jgi:hypothetical protein
MASVSLKELVVVAWQEVSDNDHISYQYMEYHNHETLVISFFKVLAGLTWFT